MATNNKNIRAAIDGFKNVVPYVDKIEKLFGKICVELEHERSNNVKRLLDVELEKLMDDWGAAMDKVGRTIPAARKALGIAEDPIIYDECPQEPLKEGDAEKLRAIADKANAKAEATEPERLTVKFDPDDRAAAAEASGNYDDPYR